MAANKVKTGNLTNHSSQVIYTERAKLIQLRQTNYKNESVPNLERFFAW